MSGCREISVEALVTRVEAMTGRMAQLNNLRKLVREAEATLLAVQGKHRSRSVRRRHRKYTSPRPLRCQVGLTTRKTVVSPSE
jgi:hypothetical protein